MMKSKTRYGEAELTLNISAASASGGQDGRFARFTSGRSFHQFRFGTLQRNVSLSNLKALAIRSIFVHGT
jgi:hypothetical protein